MIQVQNGENFKIQNDKFVITKPSEKLILKKITIKKQPLKYAFIGGMWYTKDRFSFDQNISLPYPFTTYYTLKILDQIIDGKIARSLIYVKTPIMVLQFQDSCISLEFSPYININNQDVFPFIRLDEDDENYIVTFYLLNSFDVKKKKNAWLGFGKKEKININLKEGATFNFSVKISEFNNWQEPVQKIVEKQLPKNISIEKPEEIFINAQKALFRSYDHLTGSFLQLPWKNTTGFTFGNASHSLISYEAVRLNYFSKWADETKNKQLEEWSKKLKNQFTNPNLYLKSPKIGKGTIWYNMSALTKEGLKGYFYMDCGYSGYPGGQATISYHLLNYLKSHNDEKIKYLVKQNLEYIMSTQNSDGSFPMALKQEKGMKFRKEKLSDFITSGGTGESARALIAGYKIFKDDQIKKSAINALTYLEDNNPICYNGLRDIGVNEPEAFSAVSITNAFIDAYELTKEKKYLKNAITYAHYILPWLYLYKTSNWDLIFNFHPISYSITPRLSPYETTWLVSTFLRLSKFDNKQFWAKLAKSTYNSSIKWISQNGGLSEGVFPKDFENLESLPMEQTFATVELMNASYQFIENKNLLKEKPETKIDKIREAHIEKKGDFLEIIYNKKMLLKFDLKHCKITHINNERFNDYGISFSFIGPYKLKNLIKTKIKQNLRSQIGKYILSAGDAKFFIKGVISPKIKGKIKIDPFEKHIYESKVDLIDKNSANLAFRSKFHKISMKISVNKEKQDIKIIFDPIQIEMLKHDLAVNKVFIPVIGTRLKNKTKDLLEFDNFILKIKNPSIVKNIDYIGVDQTLKTNWTHGGIFIGNFEIFIKP